jgi:hypothetical protein
VVGQRKTRWWVNKQGQGIKKRLRTIQKKVRVLKIQVVKINKVEGQKNRGMSKKNKVVGQ